MNLNVNIPDHPYWTSVYQTIKPEEGKRWGAHVSLEIGKKYACHHGFGNLPQEAINNAYEKFFEPTNYYWGADLPFRQELA